MAGHLDARRSASVNDRGEVPVAPPQCHQRRPIQCQRRVHNCHTTQGTPAALEHEVWHLQFQQHYPGQQQPEQHQLSKSVFQNEGRSGQGSVRDHPEDQRRGRRCQEQDPDIRHQQEAR